MTELKKTILLVEDDAVIAAAGQKLLESYGYSVITADSGEKALYALKKCPHIDLILMDIILGSGINGAEAAQIILAEHNLPLIFLTSHTETDIVKKTEGITSYGYVLKSSGITVLNASIKTSFKLFDENRKEKERSLELIKNGENYRLLADNVPDIIYSLDSSGNIATINNSAFVRYGYNGQEAEGKPFLNFIHPEDREVVIRSFLKAIEEKRKYTQGLQFRIMAENGISYWFELNSHARFDSNGGYAGEDGVLRDITDRKKTEIELIAAKEKAETSEKSFKQQNEMFSILLKNLSQGVFMVEAPSGKPILANDAAQKILGRGILPDADHRNLSEIYEAFRVNTLEPYPPEEMPIIMGMNGKSVYVDDMVVKRPDGSLTYLEIYGTPVADTDGKIWASLVSFSDITERKKIENELIAAKEKAEASELKLQGMLDNMLDAFFQADLNGIFTYANPAALRMYRYSSLDEIIGVQASSFYAVKEERDKLIEELKKSGIKLDWIGKGLRKDGTTFWVSMNVQVIRDKNGNVTGTQGIARDITERKLAEEALKESELKFRLLFETSMDFLYITGIDGKIIDVNKAAANLSGYSLEELKEMNILSLYHDPEERNALVKMILEQGYVENYETRGVKKDGTIVEVLVTSILRRDNEGNPAGFQGVLKNITERKLAEEKILKSLREKELLIRELYHRTKNTIQVVRGMIMLQAAEFSDNKEIRALAKNTEDRIQAISLVHQMLYMSQDLSRISIKEYIQNLCASILESYNISNNKIVFNFNIDEQSFLLDTAIPLGLIINELITNSIKHAFPDNRKGIINISLLKDKSGDNIFQYSDNGAGIADNFDFRGSPTLGLKLIHSLGEDQMLGAIEMENSNGIKVSFTFPDNIYKARV